MDNDQKFSKKVERLINNLSSRDFSDDEKESSVDDLPDEQIIRARLHLIDFDECSFDSDEIADEFSNRMGNDNFKQVVELLTTKL